MSAEFLLRLRDAHRTMGQLLDSIHWPSFDRCTCGHLRIDHRTGQPPNGHQPCGHPQCECHDYDGQHDIENPLRAA